MHRLNALSAVLLACAGGIFVTHLNAQQAGSGQLPAFRSGVELVTVDVGVVDKSGQPVRGLKAQDFVVTVGGRTRRVVTAEFIDTAEAGGSSGRRTDIVPVSTNEGGGTGRVVVFVVDSNTLETGDARQVGEAASQFLSRLTLTDRSAVVSLPVGRTMAFSWAHDRTREALLRASGSGGAATTWEYGSLAEARDIATRGGFALRDVGSRECGSSMLASGGGGGGGGGQSPGAGQSPSGGGQSGSGGTTTGGTTGGQSSGGFSSVPGGESRADQCLREIQNNAAMTWAMARANSLSSLSAFEQVLATLGDVSGNKTVVLISGGWPLDEHEQPALLKSLSAGAAAASATVFTFYVPRSSIDASRRMATSTRLEDQHLYSWPLENLASMTGGRTYRTDAGVEGVFERLTRELAGHYRIGVEKEPTDADGKDRRMRIQVTRDGVTVRAREIFDVKTYEDRDWSARMASALESPVPATALALRLTSYIASDLADPSNVRLVLAGAASRLQPGEANLLVVVRTLDGQKVVTGDRQLGDSKATVDFTTSVRVPPGTYMVRLAVMDGAGRVGSVDHFVDARPVPLGGVAVTGPLLVQLPPDDHGEPHFTVDGVRQGERLAMEVGLTGNSVSVENLEVGFEIAATADGPPLIEEPARFSPERGPRSVLAQATSDLHMLPPGEYYARVKVKAGAELIGEVRRAFRILER